jgi:hypothetical protein
MKRRPICAVLLCLGVALILFAAAASLMATAGYPALWRDYQGRLFGSEAQRWAVGPWLLSGTLLVLSAVVLRFVGGSALTDVPARWTLTLVLWLLALLWALRGAYVVWDENRVTDSWVARVALASQRSSWPVVVGGIGVFVASVLAAAIARWNARPSATTG